MKPLIVGEANPYGQDPEYAMYPFPVNSAGGRLCRNVFGLEPREYLRRFDRANLCPMRWDRICAIEVAKVIRQHSPCGRWHVLCGSKVARAFEFEPATAEDPIVTHYRDPDGLGGYLVIPHPSGRCRL